MKHFVKASIFTAILLLTVGAVSGCGLKDRLFGDTEKAVELDGDTLCTVNNEKVSLSEWFLYALPMRSRTESLYGRKIWDVAIRGESESIGEAVKKEIFDSIVYVKTVAGQAKELGVELDSDDLLEIDRLSEDYMEELSDAGKTNIGITKELVKKVYTDNLLAQRVFEKLTLNVDTYIPEDEVRHMTLEYVTVSKTYEDGKGEQATYSEDELESLRGAVRESIQNIRASEEYGSLRSAENDRLIPMTITADYKTLKERLSEELADMAFAMKDGEVSDLIETDEVLMVLGCVAREDEKATNAARIEEIERRQSEAFGRAYSEWKDKTVVRMNYEAWDAVSIG